MAYEKPAPKAGVALGAIVIVLSFAAVLLVRYTYDGPGLGKTWPVPVMAIGLCFVFGGMLETGIGITTLFGLWFAHNMNWVSFTKLWPFLIVILAVLIAIGYIRSRSAHEAERQRKQG